MKIEFKSSKQKRDKATIYARKRMANLTEEQKEYIKNRNKENEEKNYIEDFGLVIDKFLQAQSMYYIEHKNDFDQFNRLQSDAINYN